jgi:hypothetical protein
VIEAYHLTRHGGAVGVDGKDGTDFKRCELDSTANRSCTAFGDAKSLPDGVDYQIKFPIREYELKLPVDKRDKILSALRVIKDITVTFPGGQIESNELSVEEIRKSLIEIASL